MNYAKNLPQENHHRHIACGVLCRTEQNMNNDYKKAYLAYTKMTRWATIVNNADCVKKVLNYEYWNAIEEEEKNENSKFGLFLIIAGISGGVILLIVMVVVICIKRCKNIDQEDSSEIKCIPNPSGSHAEDD